MTKAEINNRIAIKEKELKKWETFKNKNNWFVFILEGVLSFVCLVAGIALICTSDVTGLVSGVFLLFAGLFMGGFDIAMSIVYGNKRRKAPYMYDKVAEEIEQLKKQLDCEASQVTSDLNVEILLKYKKLLDA
ncbi:MAG: hypothetical protein MJZ71_09185, partial [Bacteroidales bacterium]|nr:hypothetical protein [Bacteroidales bacterium]